LQRVKEEKAKAKQQYDKRAGKIKLEVGDKVLVYRVYQKCRNP